MQNEGKRLLCFLVAFSFWLFSFCLPSSAAELKEIQRRGYLTIAVKDNLRPLGFRDAGGKLQGNALAYLTVIRDHEVTHVTEIAKAIQGAGGTPVNKRQSYNFAALGDTDRFGDEPLALGAGIEVVAHRVG